MTNYTELDDATPIHDTQALARTTAPKVAPLPCAAELESLNARGAANEARGLATSRPIEELRDYAGRALAGAGLPRELASGWTALQCAAFLIGADLS